MERSLAAMKTLFVFAIALHIRHKFHGPAIDYVGLAAGSALSGAGLPGPGEPLLIAAAIIAARHSLDITSVIVVAWAAASLGGAAGWLVGWKAGRAVVCMPGPLQRLRRSVVERGEQVFARHAIWAIALTPSVVAGINRVRPAVFLPINTAVTAVMWAIPIGLGAYYAGPPIVDLVADAGWVIAGATAIFVGGAVLAALRRRRRVPARHEPE